MLDAGAGVRDERREVYKAFDERRWKIGRDALAGLENEILDGRLGCIT